MKKKLEADINELEIALDHANKANAEAQKNIKRYQQQLKDVQTALEEEQRARDEARELLGISERRANALQNELEESRTLLEQADRGRRQAEQELADCHEQLNELGAQNASISAAKRKLEAELQTLHVSIILLLFSLSLSCLPFLHVHDIRFFPVRFGRVVERGEELRGESEESDGGRREIGRRALSRAGSRPDPGETPQSARDPDQGASGTLGRGRGERFERW